MLRDAATLRSKLSMCSGLVLYQQCMHIERICPFLGNGNASRAIVWLLTLAVRQQILHRCIARVTGLQR